MVITCFIPYIDVKQSNWALSAVFVSLDDQLLDLMLKFPFISIKSELVLDMLTTSFFILVLREDYRKLDLMIGTLRLHNLFYC